MIWVIWMEWAVRLSHSIVIKQYYIISHHFLSFILFSCSFFRFFIFPSPFLFSSFTPSLFYFILSISFMFFPFLFFFATSAVWYEEQCQKPWKKSIERRDRSVLCQRREGNFSLKSSPFSLSLFHFLFLRMSFVLTIMTIEIDMTRHALSLQFSSHTFRDLRSRSLDYVTAWRGYLRSILFG